MSHEALNPYHGQSFSGFFIVLIQRLYLFSKGTIGYHDLASDEVQLLVLAGISISTALLGAFLVYRKMTLLANSLSHTILLGIVLAYALQKNLHHNILEVMHAHLSNGILLMASMLTGIATCFLTEFLNKKLRLQEDASIGLVFTSLFALGIILLTVLSRNAHIGTEVIMGNVDALQLDDLPFVWILVGFNALVCFLFFKEYVLLSFDPGLGRLFGLSPSVFNYLLMAQVSLTIIGAFRAVGIIVVLAFITGPVLTARFLAHRFKTLIAYAIVIGCAASLLGVAFSRHCLSAYALPIPTGGCVIGFIALFFVLSAIASTINSAYARK